MEVKSRFPFPEVSAFFVGYGEGYRIFLVEGTAAGKTFVLSGCEKILQKGFVPSTDKPHEKAHFYSG